MLETDRSSVSKYENGIGLPLANTLQKIAKFSALRWTVSLSKTKTSACRLTQTEVFILF